MLLRQEVPDLLGDHRRAALAAADIDGKAQFALVVLLQMQADVVGLDGCAVALRPGHRNLELAGQIGEFRMHRRPLAQDFCIGPGVGNLVGGSAREMVGSHVADAVAAGLYGVHLDAGEVGEDIRDVGQRGPVELDVLARGEVAVALVVFAGDMAEHTQLLRVERAVGNGDAQHVGVKLQVDPVHQAQRPELVFADLA